MAATHSRASKRLSKKVGLKERQVQRHLKALEAAGIIVIQPRLTKNGRTTSNLYAIDVTELRNCGRDAEHQAPADKSVASCREAADDDVDAQTLFDVPDAREGVTDYTLEGVAHDTPIYPSVEPSESLSSSTEHDTPRARGGPRATTTTTIGLSSDFEVPEAWRAWAIEHFNGLEVEQEAHGFVNYNLARHDAPQLLWNATRRRLFMQWITSAPPPSADVSGTV